MITESRVAKCLGTIEAVVSSQFVDQYIIGYTALSASQKGDQYRGHGFEHLVIISDKMTKADALSLEHMLQAQSMMKKDAGVLWEKYHGEKRDNGRSYKSDGGTQRDETEKAFSVYIVWWNI